MPFEACRHLDGTLEPVLNIINEWLITSEIGRFRAFSAPVRVPMCRRCRVLNIAAAGRCVAPQFARNCCCVASGLPFALVERQESSRNEILAEIWHAATLPELTRVKSRDDQLTERRNAKLDPSCVCVCV